MNRKKFLIGGLAAIIAAKRAPAQMVRSLLGAGRRLSESGGDAPTAADYIQDGLVAMWDGIENAGWGVHDANATTWVDLVGSVNLVPYADGTWEWLGDALRTQSNVWSARIGAIYFTQPFTIECAQKVNSVSHEDMLWSIIVQFNSGRYYAGVVHESGYYKVVNNSDWHPSLGRAIIGNAADGLTGLQLGLLYNPGGVCEVYKSGTYLTDANNGGVESTVTVAEVGIGGNARRAVQSTADDCLTYSIRIYSRALTAAEIAANYAIDKVRFGL